MIRTPLIAALCLALAACANGEFRNPFAQLLPTLGLQKDAPTTDVKQAIQLALDNIPGPLKTATLEDTKSTSVLAEFGNNRGYQTFVTPTRQTITLNRGVISATRGLGFDLMSSDAERTVVNTRKRQPGVSERRFRFLTADNQTVTLPANCYLEPADTQVIDGVTTLRMVEDCATPTRSFINTYWVTGDGYIWQSRQWIGPDNGTVLLKTLRR
jgi:hypothetical protein